MNNNNTNVSGIYKIQNKVNGRIYIGSAMNIQHRWNGHISDLNKNKHHNGRLQNAWNKYGAESFEFSVVEQCFFFILIPREQFYIDTLKPFYNIAPTAGSSLGRKCSEQTREKIGTANKGRIVSSETRALQSSAHKGRAVSDTHRIKLSNLMVGNKIFLGRTHTEETRKKLSEINKGKPKSEEHRKKLSDAMIGVIPWNKGKKGVQVGVNKGKRMSDETKRKISETKKKNKEKDIPI